jgi:hypothetical protein
LYLLLPPSPPRKDLLTSTTNGNGNGHHAAAPAQQVVAPQISIPEPIPGLQPPAKIYAAAVAAGAAKANLPAAKILVMGVLAGVYLALGGAAAFAVAGACPGASAGAAACDGPAGSSGLPRAGRCPLAPAPPPSALPLRPGCLPQAWPPATLGCTRCCSAHSACPPA